MKKYMISMLLFVITLTGCSKYQIIDESDSQVPLDQYKNIYVGWLDLDETKWEVYRYASIDDWKVCIHDMNVIGLQKFLKELMPGKTITGDTAKSNNFPDSGDLYIKNTVTKMDEKKAFRGVIGGGIVTELRAITVLIQFYDIKTKKELYHSTVNVTSSGTQWHTIEARLDAIVYNLATYLSNKLTK